MRAPFAAVLTLALVATACGPAAEPPPAPTTTSPATTAAPVTTVPEPATAVPAANWPAWATKAVVRAAPGTLAPVGDPVPAGVWVEAAVADEEGVAFVTWSEEYDRWRLVAAPAGGGAPQVRVGGDMNVLGMFRTPDGELLIVEPIRSPDRNFPAGFVVHGYRAATDEWRRVATFGNPSFAPAEMTVLGDGLLGLRGRHRDADGGFEHLRLVLYDWRARAAVVDVVLDDVRTLPEAPEGVFVDFLRPAVVWDTERQRALVVHADREAITSVGWPDGDVATRELDESRSLVEAFLSWLVPPAHAKGLSASERHAVIVGDRLHAAGSATIFSEENGQVRYRIGPVGAFSVNLDSLEIVARTEAPVSVVTAVAGRVLLAYGHGEEGAAAPLITVTDETSSGLLVLDPGTLETLAVHDVRLSRHHGVMAAGEDVYISDGHRVMALDPTTGDLTPLAGPPELDAILLAAGLRYTAPPGG